MSNVNWSLAPEGATHWDASDFRINSFMKFDGAKWFYWPPASSEKRWCRWGDSSNQDVNGMIERPKPATWSGPEDGLPPVGINVEIAKDMILSNHDGYREFKEGSTALVGGHADFGFGDLAVIRIEHEGTGYVTTCVPDAINPARTLEQLAAITSLVNASSSDDFPGISRFHAARIYDAGFKREVV